MKSLTLLCTLMFAVAGITSAQAQAPKVVGEVVTSKNFTGPDDTIGVIRFADPKVKGAFCYLSSAQKGGFSANFGMQEDRSEYVLDCYGQGNVTLPANLPTKEVISETSRSMFFKKMYVARIVDKEAKRLVYVAYTRYLIDGSPKQAMSSIPYGP